MGLLDTLGRFGHKVVNGIDNAAYNSLGGGLLGSALPPQGGQAQGGLLASTDPGSGEAPEYNGASPQAPQQQARWTPDAQQRGQLRGQYLGAFGSALSKAAYGQPLDLAGALQDYQKNAVGQIQAGQQASLQRQQAGRLAQFQQEVSAAGNNTQLLQGIVAKWAPYFPTQAKDIGESIKALRDQAPKVHGSEIRIDPQTGKPVAVNLFDDGTEKTSGYGVVPKIKNVDIGGSVRSIDENTNQQVGADIPKTMTPGEQATAKKPGDAWQFFVNSYAKGIGTTPDQMQQPQVEAALAKFKEVNADPEMRASLLASRTLAQATHQLMLGNQPTQDEAETVANDLINHRIAPEQMAATLGRDSSGAFRRMVYAATKKIAPLFDFQEASAEYQLAKSPGFQNTVRFMDSAINSIPRLQQTANAVGNSNVRAFSQIGNMAKGQFNNLDLKKFQTDRLLVGDEIAKILAGGGTGSVTSDSKLNQAVGIIKESDSPQAVAAALGEVQALLGYRRESLTRGTYMARQAQQNTASQDQATGIPQVGQQFNGGKVLKITRIK